MGENLVIQNGRYISMTYKEILEDIEKQYPGKTFTVHMIVPGEAHITIYNDK